MSHLALPIGLEGAGRRGVHACSVTAVKSLSMCFLLIALTGNRPELYLGRLVVAASVGPRERAHDPACSRSLR